MLTVQQATDAAKRYLAESFPDFATNDLRLEEIESPLQSGIWSFTFSASNPPDPSANASGLLEALRPRRKQKLVLIEKDSGTLVAVKNKAA